MKLTSLFLAATALATSMSLTGCFNSAELEALAALDTNSVQPSEALRKAWPGVYEVGIKTAQGPEVCKASVIHEYQVILSDCVPDARGETQFVNEIKLPQALSNASSGSYTVDLQTSKGKETCTASVIGLRNYANQVVLGSCKP